MNCEACEKFAAIEPGRGYVQIHIQNTI